ncbi:inactive protein RESTRICTED TEV MOVEMENT 1-like isoform X1 [Lycium ferocissimum]|uniref:inactive protein RESTRICTED TEV MOVEMENT 1-like isoform X1 n=1 Tax=Lycium ferocissimum TaxID=112874 RepID=UPI002814F0C2|nr:inactive protein RESTRICTED TEV MOVEMENT 1-like isoform X1 [Lycium ferocissimum]
MSVNMNMIKVGPAGEQWGTAWEEKGKGEIAKIFVSYSEYDISSLQFLFGENGHFVLSDRHGSARPSIYFTTVALDFPSEFLTSIRGFCLHNNLGDLRSITFVTNKRTYGPYGQMATSSSLKEFFFQLGVDRCFGGFHGTETDNCITSIGVYVKAITSSMITPTNSQVRVTRRVAVKSEED